MRNHNLFSFPVSCCNMQLMIFTVALAIHLGYSFFWIITKQISQAWQKSSWRGQLMGEATFWSPLLFWQFYSPLPNNTATFFCPYTSWQAVEKYVLESSVSSQFQLPKSVPKLHEGLKPLFNLTFRDPVFKPFAQTDQDIQNNYWLHWNLYQHRSWFRTWGLGLESRLSFSPRVLSLPVPAFSLSQLQNFSYQRPTCTYKETHGSRTKHKP